MPIFTLYGSISPYSANPISGIASNALIAPGNIDIRPSKYRSPFTRNGVISLQNTILGEISIAIIIVTINVRHIHHVRRSAKRSTIRYSAGSDSTITIIPIRIRPLCHEILAPSTGRIGTIETINRVIRSYGTNVRQRLTKNGFIIPGKGRSTFASQRRIGMYNARAIRSMRYTNRVNDSARTR